MVIWITGISAAGKSTLCLALYELIKPRMPELVLIEGEHLRTVFGSDLGYSVEERVTGVTRLRGLAQTLVGQGLGVITACVYSSPEISDWNRANLDGYFEVYVRAAIETVVSRDPKGIYAAARAGRMCNVVGLDIPYLNPVAPDLTIDNDHPRPPAELARRVAMQVPRLRALLDVPVEVEI